LQDDVYAFFFGIADESAGIDDSYLAFGISRIVYTAVPCQFQLAHQSLCIHQVLRATQCDNVYLSFSHIFHLQRSELPSSSAANYSPQGDL
jgi:hypothetical protein